MRKLDNQILIEEYYKQVEREFPEIDLAEVKRIVSAPYSFLKEQMAADELPTIRFKYFGTFLVYEERARYILERTERSMLKGTITKELYEHRKTMINEFLDKRANQKRK